MKKLIFKGTATALITPMKGGGIDYKSLGKLIEGQIEGGIVGLVIGGKTGEAATLDDSERYDLFHEAKRRVCGRCPLIFGTGTNDTRVAIRHTKYAEEVGCDGVLIVTPYYNRGTRDGVIKHYEAIAKETSLPIILYNVPSRTGVNLSLDVIAELGKIDNVVAIKEAADSEERLVALSELSESLTLYAGNDCATYSVLSLGGGGVISVVSNLYPRITSEICKQFFTDNRAKSLEIQKRLLPVINSLFLETNPAPIKYAMWKKGLCSAEMRLPMWLPAEGTRRKIDKVLEEFEKAGEAY